MFIVPGVIIVLVQYTYHLLLNSGTSKYHASKAEAMIAIFSAALMNILLVFTLTPSLTIDNFTPGLVRLAAATLAGLVLYLFVLLMFFNYTLADFWGGV